MRTLSTVTLVVVLAGTAGCSASDPEARSAAGAAAPQESPSVSSSAGSPSAGPAWLPPGATTAGTVPETPLALPPATQATAAPSPPAFPSGGLEAVDWPAYRHDLPCDGPTDAPVFGDIDADGHAEAAVVVRCPAGTSSAVLVYGGDAADVRLLGDALPAEERASVHAVEVRDSYLVVTALTRSDGTSGEPDLAVTSRWLREGPALRRTDRWLDPAFVLSVDHDE